MKTSKFFCHFYMYIYYIDHIDHIKTFYNMPNSAVEIRSEWPDTVEPAYPAAKRNYHNGYLLITAND